MDCHENGILTHEELGGIDAHFGNPEALIQLIEKKADEKELAIFSLMESKQPQKKLAKAQTNLPKILKA